MKRNMIYSAQDLLQDNAIVGLILADAVRYQIEKQYDLNDDAADVLRVQSMAGHYQSSMAHLIPAINFWHDNQALLKARFGIEFPRQVENIVKLNRKAKVKTHEKIRNIEDYFGIDFSNAVPLDIAKVLHENGFIIKDAEKLFSYNQNSLDEFKKATYRLIDGELPVSLLDSQENPLFGVPLFNDPIFTVRTENQRLEAIAGLLFGLRMDEGIDRAMFSDAYFDDLDTNMGFGIVTPMNRKNLKEPIFEDEDRIYTLDDLSHIDAWLILVNKLGIPSKELLKNNRPDKLKTFQYAEAHLIPKLSHIVLSEDGPVKYDDDIVPGFLRIIPGPGGNDTAANIISYAAIAKYISMAWTLAADIYDTDEKAALFGHYGGSDSSLLDEILSNPTVRKAQERHLPLDKFQHMMWYIQEYRRGRDNPNNNSISFPYLFLKDDDNTTTIGDTINYLENMGNSVRLGKAQGITPRRYVGFHQTPSQPFWDDLTTRMPESLEHEKAPKSYKAVVKKNLGLD